MAATHYKPSGKTNPQTSKVTPAAISDFLLGPCAENFGHQCTRPRTSTPDTLATSPDAVRKPASEKTSRARKGFVLALSRIKLSCIRRRVTAPRARFGARAGRQPIPPAPARAGACAWERSGSVVDGAACIIDRDTGGRGIGNQSLQMRAEWV